MKLDLHTHSDGSPDGGLTEAHYKAALEGGTLDYIAITDHDTIDNAKALQKALGKHIIIGEEISTTEGELVGLYLNEAIPAGLSALQTAQAIKDQGGLVYVPHPFETVRKGVTLETLDHIAPYVDIVETANGRAVFQNKAITAEAWAREHDVPGAASSDAHGRAGWGKTHTEVASAPTVRTLVKLLKDGKQTVSTAGVRGVLYPKANRLRKKVRRVA